MPRHSESTLAAIKQAIGIVDLVTSYNLPVIRAGSKFKALCVFHDDHNPSLELNPDRQSYKCWSCGAGGDIFDFVKEYERVDFPEALRMLADRAGVTLEESDGGAGSRGPSKSDLVAVNSWAERVFAEALGKSSEARAYVAERGLTQESIERFRLGYASESRDWLSSRARREGFGAELLERAGLVVVSKEVPGSSHERFRGRLIFPIRDSRGRTLGFGGRILPSTEKALAAQGKRAAKYLNTAETVLFQKRKLLFAADLAKAAAREAGWVAVVEGYTDVIAAHQVGLKNVVGTLGTALGDDHVMSLRQLADRVVLVFDGDEAGQSAADRSLEFFLGHEVDVRVLTLPSGLDPCDFLLKEGADAFRGMVDRAVDPLTYAIERAATRFDLNSLEDSRRASEWVLTILGQVRTGSRIGLDVKIARALDTLSQRLRVPLDTLQKRYKQLQRRPGLKSAERIATASAESQPASEQAAESTPPIRLADLDVSDCELVEIVLNQPAAVVRLSTRVPVAAIRDAPLRAILQACYDLHAEGLPPTFEHVTSRLDDPALRALAAGLLLPIEPAPLSKGAGPAPWEARLAGILSRMAEREWEGRLRDLKGALDETDEAMNPEEYRSLRSEYLRLLTQRPGNKTKHAS
ncbi:DNA primase [Singulisphaera sp. PoT]|uniref:DNA primase n=1 Tax=Singulisphaera sp. PoT TaxID=3411797 RepID=UPI003BF5BFB4